MSYPSLIIKCHWFSFEGISDRFAAISSQINFHMQGQILFWIKFDGWKCFNQIAIQHMAIGKLLPWKNAKSHILTSYCFSLHTCFLSSLNRWPTLSKVISRAHQFVMEMFTQQQLWNHYYVQTFINQGEPLFSFSMVHSINSVINWIQIGHCLNRRKSFFCTHPAEQGWAIYRIQMDSSPQIDEIKFLFPFSGF